MLNGQSEEVRSRVHRVLASAGKLGAKGRSLTKLRLQVGMQELVVAVLDKLGGQGGLGSASSRVTTGS